MNKTCTKCGKLTSIFNFYKDRTKKDGRNTRCKECTKKFSSEYYLLNAENIIKKISIYRKSYVPRFTRDIESRLRSLRTKAKGRKNKEFNISESDLLDLWDIQNGRCAYTGLPLVATANQPNTVSLDRIDSSNGYIVGNIQLVCAAINKMKQEYSEEMFFLFCHLVSQNSKLSEIPERLLARYVPVGASEYIAPNNHSLCSDVERM